MNFKNIASNLIYKLIIGLVLASGVVMAVVHFLQLYHVYLTQFTNGVQIETASYAVLFIACITGIYFLLSVDTVPKKTSAEIVLPSSQSNIQEIGMTFLQGFMNGLKRPKNFQTQKQERY